MSSGASVSNPSGAAPSARRVAVVHEWLNSHAGSEQTFLAMAAALPEADVYALTANPDQSFDFGGRTPTTTVLNRVAARRGGSALTLPLMPVAWRLLRSRPYDLVVTSSHAYCRAFPAAAHAVHLSYTHTPIRYVWLGDLDERTTKWRVPTIVLKPFRAYDRHLSRTVDDFAANSTVTRERIEEFYGRTARVIPPPCDTEYFSIDATVQRRHLLSVSRLVPYKRHDLAIHVAARLGEQLVIAGRGPDEARLRALAEEVHPGGVDFVIGPDRQRLRELYRAATVLIFGAFEDFGIVPVEAQACGTPVVGFDGGGTRDTVIDGVSGRLAPTQSTADFADAVRMVLSVQLSPVMCRESATRFSNERFRIEFSEWVTAFT